VEKDGKSKFHMWETEIDLVKIWGKGSAKIDIGAYHQVSLWLK